MALWGFVAGKEAWYTVAEASLKSVVTPVWETVSSVNNLKAVGSAAINAVIEHPLTAAATAAVGVATVYAYKKKGFGIGLGQFSAGFNNFLAHFNVDVGLGSKQPTQVQDLNSRMTALERSQREGREAEAREHEATRGAIQSLRDALMQRFAGVTNRLSNMADADIENQRTLVGHHTALLQQMGANQRATDDSLKAIVGATSQTNSNVARLLPK